MSLAYLISSATHTFQCAVNPISLLNSDGKLISDHYLPHLAANVVYRYAVKVGYYMVTYLDCLDFVGLRCLELDFVPSMDLGLAWNFPKVSALAFASFDFVDRGSRLATALAFASFDLFAVFVNCQAANAHPADLLATLSVAFAVEPNGNNEYKGDEKH